MIVFLLKFVVVGVIVYILFGLMLVLPIKYFEKRKIKRNNQIISQITEFTVEHKHFGENTLVALNKELTQCCLINLNEIPEEERLQAKKYFRFFTDEDILYFQLFENRVILTSPSEAVDGAFAGALLFGKWGAVAGAMVGEDNFQISTTVNRLELRLVLNDTSNPIADIDFIYTSVEGGVERSSPYYELRSKAARKWHAYFTIMMKNAKNRKKLKNLADNLTS